MVLPFPIFAVSSSTLVVSWMWLMRYLQKVPLVYTTIPGILFLNHLILLNGPCYLSSHRNNTKIQSYRSSFIAHDSNGFCIIAFLCRATSSQFVLPFHKFLKSINHSFSVGMRFRLSFETEDAADRRCAFNGLLLCG